MTKTGYYMPWYLIGGIGVVIGGALMCKSFLYPLPLSISH